MLLKLRPLLINSLLLSSVPTPMMLFTTMLTSKLLILRRKFHSSTTLMPLVPPNSVPNNHPLSSSDNSRRKLTSTLEPLTKKLLVNSTSPSCSQLFSNSPWTISMLFSLSNKIFSSSSERRMTTTLISKKFSQRPPTPSRDRFFSLTLELQTRSNLNSLNSWELLKRTSQLSDFFFQPT